MLDHSDIGLNSMLDHSDIGLNSMSDHSDIELNSMSDHSDIGLNSDPFNIGLYCRVVRYYLRYWTNIFKPYPISDLRIQIVLVVQ
jgi:hypothetical protein